MCLEFMLFRDQILGSEGIEMIYFEAYNENYWSASLSALSLGRLLQKIVNLWKYFSFECVGATEKWEFIYTNRTTEGLEKIILLFLNTSFVYKIIWKLIFLKISFKRSKSSNSRNSDWTA